MEHVEHAGSSTATPKLYISDRTCEVPGAVELALEILPAFNLRSTEVVLVELFINGNPRDQRLIRGLSSHQKRLFTVPNRDWRADERGGFIVYEACFHITHGTLIRQASSEPTSLTKIKGKTYKVLHRIARQNLHEDDPTDNNDILEHGEAAASDHESSQEQFYDARSQFENMPGTFPAEEEPIAEDPATAVDDSPTNNQHIINSGEARKTTNISASPTEDDLVRLDQAKRQIFQEDNSSGMGAFTAVITSPVNASSPPVHDPDTEMLDDLASNAEQSEDEETAPRQKNPMQTFGTIDGFLSSSKTVAQLGINNHDIDPDDEAENLVHNRKPLRRTSFAPQLNNSDEFAGSDDTNEMAPCSKDGSTADAGKTRTTTPRPQTHRDPAAKKASKTKWDLSGGRVNNELRKRLADNDEKIGERQSTLKLWHGKNFGTDSTRNAANIRLCNVVKKQVKLHTLLVTFTNASVAADLRRKLQHWADGKVDEYESQLDAIFSAVQNAPSNDLTAAKQRADDDSAEDSNDDFALPLMSSQQQKMAAALLPEDRPVRKTTDAQPRESAASDQQGQSSTSRTMVSLVNDTPENSDDEELPEFNHLFVARLPKGGLTETLSARNAGKSAERPKKKPRVE